MNLVDRAKNILLKPKQEWEIINEETTTTADLYKNYRLNTEKRGLKQGNNLVITMVYMDKNSEG